MKFLDILDHFCRIKSKEISYEEIGVIKDIEQLDNIILEMIGPSDGSLEYQLKYGLCLKAYSLVFNSTPVEKETVTLSCNKKADKKPKIEEIAETDFVDIESEISKGLKKQVDKELLKELGIEGE